jgi:hypothetical protein
MEAIVLGVAGTLFVGALLSLLDQAIHTFIFRFR